MEAAIILKATAVASGFAAAAMAFPEIVGALRRLKATSRADAAASADQSSPMARLLRNGIPPATTAAQSLSRLPWMEAFFHELSWLARTRGYETDSLRCGGVALAASAALLPLGWAVSSSAVFGLMLCVCFAGGLFIFARQRHEHQAEDVRESVPDVLRTMSACFRSGYTLLQTFRHLAAEAQSPLRPLFQRAASDLETGGTVEDALTRLRGESSLPEFAFVTAALEIQHQTGGSMQAIIDSACDSIEGELALRRQLRVQTAQARLSMRVVTIMPFVLMAVFSFVSPEFLSPFFSSGLGFAVLCTAVGMQAAGVLAVRRMLNVGEA